MAVFTLTLAQTQIGKELYLYPSAAGCNTDFIPVGEANNWECVDDPVTVPADDTTYVYHNTPSVSHDLYTLPNHTVESGDINFVQVFGRAKSHLYTPSPDSVYKILIADGTCTDVYKSGNIDLISEYNTYNHLWATNPRTSEAWTWDEIDSLQIGIECSSVTIEGEARTLTLRPSAAGDKTNIPFRVGDDANYKCVDEVSRDDFTTTVYITIIGDDPEELQEIDLYNLEDSAGGAYTITGIEVFSWIYHNGLYSYGQNWSKAKIKTHGTEYTGDQWSPGVYTWELMSHGWAVNPFTAAAWTWDEIDALQAGIEMHTCSWCSKNYCTQVYAVVYYEIADVNAEIRTAQEYAVVNYNEDVEYTLNKPEQVSVNHTQNIKMLNFWSGRRAVYGLTRNKRTLVMTGNQYGENACAEVKYIHEMGLAGDEITLSGLDSTEFNKDFRIISFGWKKVTTKPLKYDWILELEYA